LRFFAKSTTNIIAVHTARLDLAEAAIRYASLPSQPPMFASGPFCFRGLGMLSEMHSHAMASMVPAIASVASAGLRIKLSIAYPSVAERATDAEAGLHVSLLGTDRSFIERSCCTNP
jgi:hypothetical protein